MQYRAEIDGLRAVAVVPVVLFHAGFSIFSGGFVGVDIFFVISGYLIASIIIKEQVKGCFTLTSFYERRARRILPALMLLVLMTIVASWFLLLPTELIDFGESLISVGIFASNILFAQQSNYFAPTAESVPLLHTWSLAVEEQFYLVFPIFMIFTVTWLKQSRISILALLAILSFIYCEWVWRNTPETNFYSTISRAWELMAGVFCAFYLQKAKEPNPLLAQVGSILGLLFISYSVFFFNKDIPFPSIYTFVPVAGSVLLILFAKPNTIAGRLLSLPLLVGIGLISYSAYLWHQPLFVFTRINSYDELSNIVLLSLSLLAFALAYISWRWVEKPFRNRNWLSRSQVLWLALLCSIVLIAMGVGLVIGNGFE